MAGKSIYPSIPSPGNDARSMRATLDAIQQSMTMIIMNAQSPSPNYTPSSAAQIFVTNAGLSTFVANQIALSKQAVGAAGNAAAARMALASAPAPQPVVPSMMQVKTTRVS
jgi:hypothetical protein